MTISSDSRTSPGGKESIPVRCRRLASHAFRAAKTFLSRCASGTVTVLRRGWYAALPEAVRLVRVSVRTVTATSAAAAARLSALFRMLRVGRGTEVIPSNAQWIGGRVSQEDAIGCSDFFDRAFVVHGGCLGVVADGVGARGLGGEAARTAVAVVLREYAAKPSGEPIAGALRRAVTAADFAVRDRARELGVSGRLGATVAAAVISRDGAEWIAVGDPRIFFVRGGTARLLNTGSLNTAGGSSSVSQELVQSAGGSAPQPSRIVSSCVGGDAIAIEASSVRLPLSAGDGLVICTDGAYRWVEESDIATALAAVQNSPAQSDPAERILMMVKAKAGAAAASGAVPSSDQDNASVICLCLPTEKLSPAEAFRDPRTLFWIALVILLAAISALSIAIP